MAEEVTRTPEQASDNLHLRGDIIQSLQRELIHGGHTLKAIPETISVIAEKDLWRERIEPQTGEAVTFESFEEFVTAPPLEGLGSSVRQLKHLCQDDKEALDWIDKATVGKPGGDRRSQEYKTNVNNINNDSPRKSPVGTSAAAAIRKLRKDRPDLHERVIAGEISPHAAMVEAGFRKKTFVVPEDLPSLARALLKKRIDPDELYRAMGEAKLEQEQASQG